MLLADAVLSRYSIPPSLPSLTNPDRSLRIDEAIPSGPLHPQYDTMDVSVTQKRKGDDYLDRLNTYPRTKLRKTQSTAHTARVPFTDEDDFFSSDQITSDPTFFDDFIPEESQVSPQRHSSPSKVKHIPLPNERNAESAQEHTESSKENHDFHTAGDGVSSRGGHVRTPASVRRDSPDLKRTYDNDAQKSPHVESVDRLTGQSTHLDPPPTVGEELLPTVQEEPDSNTSGDGKDAHGNAEVLSSTTETTIPIARAPEDPLPPLNEQGDTPVHPITAEDTDSSRLVDCQRARSNDSTGPSPRPSILQPTHPSYTISAQTATPVPTVRRTSIRTPRSKPSHESDTPDSTIAKSRSKGSASKTGSSTRTKSSKETPVKQIGLQFEISDMQTDNAYLVKHRKETRSETGSQWSRATKHPSIYSSITRYARVKHNVGEIVSLDFLEGHGGSAKILEIRETDMIFIVIQWLYSRTDAARLGCKLPSLDKWPKGFYVLSDHFQVVCLENLDGKSASTALEDVYWKVGAGCLRPFNELQRLLQHQAG